MQRLLDCRRCLVGASQASRQLKRRPLHAKTYSSAPFSSLAASFFSHNASLAAAALPRTEHFWQNTSSTVGLHETNSRQHSELLSPSPTIRHALIEYPPSSIPLTAYKPAPPLTATRLLRIYSQLSKSRLTTLITLTAMAGVAISPLPASVPVLLSTALGTALCSASANTINQMFEVPFDAQMTRTRNRPLVRRAISPLHAASFAACTGIAGPVLLYTCVAPVTAALGVLNIFLYAGVYTFMKRRSIWNTWVGSVVGGIPPLMGWTAVGGEILPSSTNPTEFFLPEAILSPLTSLTTLFPLENPPLSAVSNPLAALSLFLVLFSWQFPHFNALSHLLRHSYASAGYRMLVCIDPHKNALVSLRHTLLLAVPICAVLVPLSGLTTWWFALTSAVPNTILLKAAWAFYRKGGEKEAKKVWVTSLWWLPVILGLMMIHKQGMEWANRFGLGTRKEDESAVAVEESS